MTPADGYVPDGGKTHNDSVIDELIGKLESDPAAADLLISLLSQRIHEQNEAASLQEAEHYIQVRALGSGAAVTADANGIGRDVLGNSLFDTLNFVPNSTGAPTVNAANPRQIDVPTSGGGGADCLFDYLVSTCFATLSGFTEGKAYTSLSGCTFKGYSTIQGAVTNAGTLSSSDSSTIAICSGTYAEKITRTDVSGASLILLGTGQANTIIKPATGSGTLLTIPTQSLGGNAVVISGITFDTSGMNPGAVGIAGGGSQRIKMNNCHIQLGNSTDVGINPGNSAAAGWELSQVNFSGSGIGIQTDTSLSVANIILNSCSFESGLAIGMFMRGDSNGSVSGCWFGCTIGVKYDGASTVLGMSITGSTFYACGTGIQHVGGNVANNGTFTWGQNYFEGCATAIDLSTLTGNLFGISIVGNTLKAGTNGIKLHSTRVKDSIILGNSFASYGAGTEISGMTLAQAQAANTQITHNSTGSGTAIVDSGLGHSTIVGGVEHHTALAIVDNTVISTTVPYAVVGPFAAAATITAVEAVCGDNVTCGATSAIFDVHKILSANENTDGQGTTIFTTQANRPTISNGNKKSTTTAPDVTAIAAGDLLAIYSDQQGSNLTVATVAVRCTMP